MSSMKTLKVVITKNTNIKWEILISTSVMNATLTYGKDWMHM